ncbi:MAG: histidine kinase [Actinomycetota bacterium]
MTDSIRAFVRDPRPSGAPGVRWQDIALGIVLCALAVLSAVFEDEISWRPLAGALGISVAIALVWRNRQAFAVAAGSAIAVTVVHAATWIADVDLALTFPLFPSLLVAIYALFRRASGKEALLGAAITGVMHVVTSFHSDSTWYESLLFTTFWLFPAALGLAMRNRARLHERNVTQARVDERQQLARELHDTIAHHVSAITIQAQAGRAVAAANPDAAVEVLATVEEQAARALDEMRRMVTVLRDDESLPELLPQSGLADITALAEVDGGLPVDVVFEGRLDHLGPGMEASVFRFAQEGVTNARRHARHATRVRLLVHGHDDRVEVSVSDDGDPSALGGGGGFGLVGLEERAAQLGGTFTAGPDEVRGWAIHASLPLNGVAGGGR